MARILYLLIIITAVFSCKQDSKEQKSEDTAQATVYNQDSKPEQMASKQTSTGIRQLIVPGAKIGKTSLGMDASELESLLGKPDMSDAAMGKAWLIWYGKPDVHNNKTELNVYTAYKDSNMREKTVQQIRVTSSYFKTPEGIGVYSSEQDIRSVFPALKPAMRYTDGDRTIDVLDEKEKGIAFELVRAREEAICTGVIIHLPGKAVTESYIYLHPDVKIID